jgi:hypothetical protein
MPRRAKADCPEPKPVYSEPAEVAPHQWRFEMEMLEQQERYKYHRLRQKLAEELLLTSAMEGELEAIQSLLLIVSEAIRDGCPLTNGVADFISKALANIHGGMKGDDAFGIKRKRGGKDTRAPRGRAYFMADCVERLRHHSGLTLELAIEEVSERFSAPPDTAKLAWKKNYKEVRRSFEIEKRSFGAIHEVLWPG